MFVRIKTNKFIHANSVKNGNSFSTSSVQSCANGNGQRTFVIFLYKWFHTKQHFYSSNSTFFVWFLVILQYGYYTVTTHATNEIQTVKHKLQFHKNLSESCNNATIITSNHQISQTFDMLITKSKHRNINYYLKFQQKKVFQSIKQTVEEE